MPVVHELATKLNIGGAWYYTGDNVQLDEEDAAVMAMRGMSKPAKPGAIPKNIPQKQKSSEPEKVSAKEVGDAGIVTKTEQPSEQSRGPARRNR
jgi:hypothetical protein